MLEFVYTGQNPVWGHLLEVFNGDLARIINLVLIADKYLLDRLKEHTENGILCDVEKSFTKIIVPAGESIDAFDPKSDYPEGRCHTKEHIAKLISKVLEMNIQPLENLRGQIMDKLIAHRGVLKDKEITEAVCTSTELSVSLHFEEHREVLIFTTEKVKLVVRTQLQFEKLQSRLEIVEKKLERTLKRPEKRAAVNDGLKPAKRKHI